jgi:hypothetical protein
MVAALAAVPLLANAATPTFGSIVLANATDFGGEPGLDVDSTGYAYENAPSGGGASWVYRSGDGGATWSDFPAPVASPGGFDSNGAIDACDTYYMSDLYIGGATVHFTKDRGQTWISQPLTLASVPGDRQWIETGPGCGVLYESWTNVATGSTWIAKSTDGGLTWPVQAEVSGATDIIGNLAVDKTTGDVYQAYAQGGYKMAVSHNGGGAWLTKTVYAAPTGVTLGDSFPVVTVDRAGNVYAVWEQDTVTGKGRTATHRFDIAYAYSTNHGDSWSAPKVIQSGSTGSNVFPWAVGGAAGHLDVVWYRADAGNANPNGNSGPWFVDFAQSLNAATSSSTFTTVKATPVSIHNDVICTSGTGCSGASRDLLDFFEVALFPDGHAGIAFALDTTNVAAGTGNGDPRNAFVAQIGGDFA